MRYQDDVDQDSGRGVVLPVRRPMLDRNGQVVTRGAPEGGGLRSATAPPERPITVGEAARVLGLSEDTILRRVKSGEMKGRKMRGVVLLSRASVEALLPQQVPALVPFARTVALLPLLTDDERRRVAILALEGRVRRGS